MNITYETLDGELLDLTNLPRAEAAYFEMMMSNWHTRMPFGRFLNMVTGPENPILAPGNRVTHEVAAHPLYKAVRDLEDRLGIILEELRADPGDLPADADPTLDTWLPVTNAAAERGVSEQSIRLALERGDLIGTSTRPRMVSGRSLARWEVNRTRQRAGRQKSSKKTAAVAPA